MPICLDAFMEFLELSGPSCVQAFVATALYIRANQKGGLTPSTIQKGGLTPARFQKKAW